MKNLFILFFFVFSTITTSILFSQCTTATYGQFPTVTYVPTQDNNWASITSAGYSGEFSVVSVTLGVRYQFLTFRSSNGASRFLTITNASTNGVILSKTTTNAYSDSASWTATFTGNIRFYTHVASSCGSGPQSVTRLIRAILPPPINDNPLGSLLLTVNDPSGYITYSNVGSTNTTTESTPTCGMYSGQDVWFKIVVPNNITILEFDTQSGVITDGAMSIYRGTLGSLNLIECDDDDGLDGLMPWISRSDFIPGETIYIRFWEYGGNVSGTFKIFVSTPQALPVELLYFEGVRYPTFNNLKWATASEQNSSHFDIERSEDGENWRVVGTKSSAGNSQSLINYYYLDYYNQDNTVYYRLLQYDIDGQYEIYGPISIEGFFSSKKIVKYINLAGQEVNETYKGVVLEVYEDGTMRKIIR